MPRPIPDHHKRDDQQLRQRHDGAGNPGRHLGAKDDRQRPDAVQLVTFQRLAISQRHDAMGTKGIQSAVMPIWIDGGPDSRTAARAAHDRFKPEAMIVGASCTAELIHDNPGGLAGTLGLSCPVIALDPPSYSRRENFGADETFLPLVRNLTKPLPKTEVLTCNLRGATALGFRHRDDAAEFAAITDLPAQPDETGLRLPWWSASVDSTYLTGKRVFIFGDATHVIAAARIAADEISFDVIGMGCFNREYARPMPAAAKDRGLEAGGADFRRSSGCRAPVQCRDPAHR